MLLMKPLKACLQPSKVAAVCVLAQKVMLRLHGALALQCSISNLLMLPATIVKQVLAGGPIRTCVCTCQ